MSMHLDAFVLGLATEEMDPALSNIHHLPGDSSSPRLTDPYYPCGGSGTIISRRVCSNCQATNSSYWRKDGEGRALCNACGLFLRTHGRHRPLVLQRNREARRGKQRPPNCGNCGTDDTPLWRRVNGNETVCNACGLYFRLHGTHRPPPTATATEAKLSQKQMDMTNTLKSPIFIQEFQAIDQNENILAPPNQTSPHRSDPPIVAGNVWHAYEPKTAAGGGGKFIMVSGYGTQVRLRRPSLDPDEVMAEWEEEAVMEMAARSTMA